VNNEDSSKETDMFDDTGLTSGSMGPLEQARENLHMCAKMITMQSTLRGLLEWSTVLQDINKDEDISHEEKLKNESELATIEKVWTAFADELYRKHGISA